MHVRYVSECERKYHRVSIVLPWSIIGVLSFSNTVSPEGGFNKYPQRLSIQWEKQYKELSNKLEKNAWTQKVYDWVSTVKAVSIE